MSAQPATSSSFKITWLLGAFAALTIFAFIAGYSQQMAYLYKDYSQQKASDRLKTLAKLQGEENEALQTLDWVDQDKKIVHIPIDQAEAVEIPTLLLKPAVMGAEIPGSAPAPAATNAAPAAATPPSTNAAPANPAAPAAKAPAGVKPAPAPASTNAAPAKPKAPAQPKQ